MTVSQLYKYMSQKVIPESVMPQNISACLMDDNAQIPELDAFTFLNRVRALGIGSADFLYLLEGCGAPEEAVDKIKSNPAMNLQGLIVTLESSGLTARDYTRMLYTARQLWERTLTMQLDEIERGEEEIISEVLGEPSAEEDIPEEDEVYEEEFTERSDPEDQAAYAQASEDYDGDTEAEQSQPDSDTESDIPAEDNSEEADGYDTPDDENEAYEPEEEDGQDEESDTSERAKGSFHVNIEYERFDDDTPVIRTARQVQREPLDFGIHDREERAKTNTGKLVASAVGACVLVGTALTLSYLGFSGGEAVKAPDIDFAADSSQIFSEVLTAYNNDKIGGESISPRSFADGSVFGSMLITKPSNGSDRVALGTYTIGDSVFCAYDDEINLYRKVEGSLLRLGTIPAPEGGEYIGIIPMEDRFAAVFRDDNSAGFICYDEGGEAQYSCNQRGVLTDIAVTDSEISLGTVYIPRYTENFKAENTDKYLPIIQLDKSATVMSPTDIIVSGDANGCGFAVYAEYNLSDGTISDSGAVLGNPVFSGAEGLFGVMKSDSGCEVVTVSETENAEGEKSRQVNSTEILTGEKLAFDGGEVFAAVVKPEDSEELVYLFGRNGEGEITAMSALENLPEEFTSMRLDSGVLYFCSDSRVLAAVDISDIENPKQLELTAEHGMIKGDYALTTKPTGTTVKLTLYKRTDKKATELSSYTKSITSGGNEAAVSGDLNTFILEGEERCGAAFNYFDGVSRISEYGLFGRAKTSAMLFDDSVGYTAAAVFDGEVRLISGDRSYLLK